MTDEIIIADQAWVGDWGHAKITFQGLVGIAIVPLVLVGLLESCTCE